MQQFKVTTFNAEWMLSIFGSAWKKWDGKIPVSFKGGRSGGAWLAKIDDVPGLCNRISGLIKKVNPDILGILEGPPLKEQMELFVKQYLDNEYAVYQSNVRAQSIFMLVRKTIPAQITHIPHTSDELVLLRKRFYFYPWLGYCLKDRKRHGFYRIPLVLKVIVPEKRELQFVVVHTKSKISSLTDKQWKAGTKKPIIEALDARQELSAEVGQLRRYLDKELSGSDQNKGVIVMGDMNDGPLRDLMEEQFFLQNILDELVGSFLRPDTLMRHAMTPQTLATAKSTHFRDAFQDDKMVEELIDHIVVSPSVVSGTGAFTLKPDSCQVEETAYQQFNDDIADNDRGLRPSDHKPVSAIIEY